MFQKLFRKKTSSDIPPSTDDQAVIVYLKGTGLPDEVYAEYDLDTLEDRLSRTIAEGKLGDFDGTESGPEETALFMYGPDADRLFSGIEPILRAYPLCENARIVIRFGTPGAKLREITL